MNNTGNSAWQELRTDAERRGNHGPMRSRASSAFEAELRRLLNSYNGTDISGLWIDWTIPSKEPVWIGAPGGETGDAA